MAPLHPLESVAEAQLHKIRKERSPVGHVSLDALVDGVKDQGHHAHHSGTEDGGVAPETVRVRQVERVEAVGVRARIERVEAVRVKAREEILEVEASPAPLGEHSASVSESLGITVSDGHTNHLRYRSKSFPRTLNLTSMRFSASSSNTWARGSRAM